MSRLTRANMKKTLYYFKRNGIKKTFYAVLERLEERRQIPYVLEPLTDQELEAQRLVVDKWELQRKMTKAPEESMPTFSILVPTYCTAQKYLREMMDSLLAQTYPYWELILADATPGDEVKLVVGTYDDKRIRYVQLEKNAGISENTNRALELASGDYVGLLDHDDVLTPDALYEMVSRIIKEKKAGRELELLYSDEDKCNGEGTVYYEPNFKPDFNLDLLLSNNYICHFLVMKRTLIQGLKFRPEYDGAQDFDLCLRAAWELKDREELIAHVPRVLYHWRCHTGSTAENPQSKLYAYDAGRRAVQDYADRAGWKAVAKETSHVGFFNLIYEDGIFANRQDVGACGGNVVQRGRIVGGLMDKTGRVVYEKLPLCYSGYLHRAGLHQTAEVLDLRNLAVRQECREIFEKAVGVPYREKVNTHIFDTSSLPKDFDYKEGSLKFAKSLQEAGYRAVFMPDMQAVKG